MSINNSLLTQRLRQLSGAPILAHEGDAGFFSRRELMTYCPTSWVGRLFLKTPAPHEPYEPFVPDIMMRNDEPMELRDFGVDGIVRHTASHTPRSIAVELSSLDALVGDLIASGILIGEIARTRRPISPPFEDDPKTFRVNSNPALSAKLLKLNKLHRILKPTLSVCYVFGMSDMQCRNARVRGIKAKTN